MYALSFNAKCNIISPMEKKKIMIITSYIEGEKDKIDELIRDTAADFIICADGGVIYAERAGITPDLIVGDFDSLGHAPKGDNVIKVPVEKDDTDLQLALSLAIENHAKEITIIGGIGGRVDHTIGNIQNIVHYSENGVEINMIDPMQSITVQRPGTRIYKGGAGMKFSAFAHTPEVTGLTYKGAYYPLNNHTITNSFPLGISNEFVDSQIEVSFKTGILIVVRTLL